VAQGPGWRLRAPYHGTKKVSAPFSAEKSIFCLGKDLALNLPLILVSDTAAHAVGSK